VKRHDVKFPGPGFLILRTAIGVMHAIARSGARTCEIGRPRRVSSLFVRRPLASTLQLSHHSQAYQDILHHVSIRSSHRHRARTNYAERSSIDVLMETGEGLPRSCKVSSRTPSISSAVHWASVWSVLSSDRNFRGPSLLFRWRGCPITVYPESISLG
jgi:hypothetical protein